MPLALTLAGRDMSTISTDSKSFGKVGSVVQKHTAIHLTLYYAPGILTSLHHLIAN